HVPIEQARVHLGDEVDWHVLVPGPTGGKAGRSSLASVLVTSHPDLRKYLDGTLGAVTLAQEPQRSGDYPRPHARYRLGDVTGVVRCAKRSEALIGVVRRQAAAAARREELHRERNDLLRQREHEQQLLHAEREASRNAEARARSLGELAHMLDEMEGRRAEMRALREAAESASVRLATTAR